MPRYVAFLRGINLGRRRLPMSRLAGLFEDLGFTDVATFIASGNVIFTAPARNATALEDRIAAHLAQELGYEVDTFVRTTAQVVTVARDQPFPEAGQPGITIHVGFLRQPLPPATARAFTAIATPDDAFAVRGAEFYWLCRTRTSDSEVWTLPALKALRLPSATLRNLTSLQKLVDRHCS